jgi:hypothetical protein
MRKIIIISLVVVLCISIFVNVVYATLGNKTITVTYRNISIYVNGQKKTPEEEPFIYNGRTYVPLRFISEALDKEVTWNETNSRIDINDKVAATGSWVKVAEFTGGDSVKTKQFTIHSKTWKVVFTGQETIADLGYFHFFAYKVGEDFSTDSATGTFKDGKLNNETYVYKGNDDFYLDITAANCTYDIVVFEQK